MLRKVLTVFLIFLINISDIFAYKSGIELSDVFAFKSSFDLSDVVRYKMNKLSPKIPRKSSFKPREDDNKPLILTPYIQSGQIQKAKELSKVGSLPNAPNVTSYSGFFTVQNMHNNNLFFWFFPAMNSDPKAPVILWLQGGPGTTGLFGLFLEHGPFIIDSNLTAKMRTYSWTKSFHMIYVDNPVGTGFSFTTSKIGYCRNEDDVATDLYNFLLQFFRMFPEYKNNDFYIAGESYAGKYVPSLAYMIHTQGNAAQINLKGIAIGNGFCDPETMVDYSSYLYQLGLIDRKQADVMRNVSDSIKQLIRRKEYYEALVEMDQLVLQLHSLPYLSYFRNYTDFQFTYNYLITNWPEDYFHYVDYISSLEFKKAVHVGNIAFSDGTEAQRHLLLDVMQSVKPKVAVLMDNYRVLFYSGQLDVVVPYPLTMNFLYSIEWKNATAYKDAERQVWKIEGSEEIAGYVHNVGDFYEVLVRNAGHVVPYDQPKAALDLITRFIKQKSYA